MWKGVWARSIILRYYITDDGIRSLRFQNQRLLFYCCIRLKISSLGEIQMLTVYSWGVYRKVGIQTVKCEIHG